MLLVAGLYGKKYLSVEEVPRAGHANINPERYRLDTKETLPDGMVRVPGWTVTSASGASQFRDFFIDRFEVTNREFKKFVAAGGYARRDLWEHEFFRDGQPMSWLDAMAIFTDTTGRSGPAQWVAGSYPDGDDDYPVSGISWYEAAAFARYSGKELPTIHHWRRAFAIGTLAWMFPASNVENSELAPLGHYQGIGWTGTFDMIGNVREWCLNAVGDERAIVGGGWSDAFYMAAETVAHPGRIGPFDRSATNGFRLAITNDEPAVTARAQEPIAEPMAVPIREPVSDEVFAVFLRSFDYDPTPLNATIDATESTRNWTRERISIDAGRDGDRLTLYLYLPHGDISRFQTIVYWPGSGAFIRDAKPYFDLLGTPPEDKKHVVEPTGHFVPPAVVIGETLNWLDKYLGAPSP